MPDEAQEKTEQPTGRRLNKARQEGSVARSTDLTSGLVLLAGLLMLVILGRGMTEACLHAFQVVFRHAPELELNAATLPEFGRQGMLYMVKLLAPFLLAVAAVGVLSNVLQFGWLFTVRPLTPKLNVLNPSAGVKRILSGRSWAELVKGLVKVVLVGWVGYLVVKSTLPKFVPLADMGVMAVITTVAGAALKLSFYIALLVLLLGVADFRFQKWYHLRSLRMTKQEVKDEYKQTEGDPVVKGRIRRIQYKAALNRMIKKLPEADVVVVNPTHIAVALKYDPAKMSAPQVVAKGKRLLAEKIRAIAEEHGIPIVQDPPLARMLYRLVDVGMEIPYELYQAVAEVLALVYRMREHSAGLK